jgi:nudix-type nucleoside diphosphatase (YffH/AdpP family)
MGTIRILPAFCQNLTRNRRPRVTGHRIVKTETLYEGRNDLLKLAIEAPGGQTFLREVVDAPPAAAVLAYDPERRRAILVRQFRAPALQAGADPNLLEAIAGLLDDDDPETCARREAMEEAGLRLTTLEPVGVIWATPGYSTERIWLFLAPYSAADRVAEGGGLAEESEDIEVLEVSLTELAVLVERGDIADLKTVALVQALRIRRSDLFG